MKKKIFLSVIAAIALVCCYVICSYSLNSEAPKQQLKTADEELYANLEIFSDVLSLIEREYVQEQNPKDIVYGALEGMLVSLDPYSQFLAPDVYQELKVETEGAFGGIGIVIAIKDGLLTIVSPLEGTPGHSAGLQSGDRIVKIDDETTKGITLTNAVKKLRGKPKTEVNLTILRESEQRLLTFKITRDIIKIESIKDAKVLNNNIGYLKILEFQENTLPDFKKAMKKLSESNIEGLILDLRNNPGGLLDIAVAISSEFLPKGKMIVYTKGRSSKQNLEFKSSGGSFLEKPLVVLINKGSASGSEILAGAIKDSNRGLILGERSFGKASVQTIIPLKDESAVRLTTAHYYTPNGSLIHEKGIDPDIGITEVIKKAKPSAAGPDIDTEILFKDIDEGKEGLSLETKEQEALDSVLEQAIDLMKGLIKYRTMLSGS